MAWEPELESEPGCEPEFESEQGCEPELELESELAAPACIR